MHDLNIILLSNSTPIEYALSGTSTGTYRHTLLDFQDGLCPQKADTQKCGCRLRANAHGAASVPVQAMMLGVVTYHMQRWKSGVQAQTRCDIRNRIPTERRRSFQFASTNESPFDFFMASFPFGNQKSPCLKTPSDRR